LLGTSLGKGDLRIEEPEPCLPGAIGRGSQGYDTARLLQISLKERSRGLLVPALGSLRSPAVREGKREKRQHANYSAFGDSFAAQAALRHLPYSLQPATSGELTFHEYYVIPLA
jgi:hypothetical protein